MVTNNRMSDWLSGSLLFTKMGGVLVSLIVLLVFLIFVLI